MNELLVAEAELGEQARSFMESELGRVMLGISEQDAQLAREELAEVDPTDSKKITELQNKIKFAQSFPERLRILVANGDAAIIEFRHQQQEQ